MGKMTMSLFTKVLKSRYLQGDRKTKSRILDEFCLTSGYNRKAAIRLFTRGLAEIKNKPPGRKKIYDPNLLLPPWVA